MSSLFNKPATVLFTYSEPLSEGAKSANDEGEGFQHEIEGGQQERLADPFHRGHDFKLRAIASIALI